jgi:hypothetical protein
MVNIELIDVNYTRKNMNQPKVDPAKLLAIELFKQIAPRMDMNINEILAGVCIVLSTIAAEAGMTEEKAVYAFTKSFRQAQQRVKKVTQHE